MGYYLEVPQPKNKAVQILALFPGSFRIPHPKLISDLSKEVYVCVVENPGLPFDAAALIYDLRELQIKGWPGETRKRDWLCIPTAEVLKAQPEFQKYLPVISEEKK